MDNTSPKNSGRTTMNRRTDRSIPDSKSVVSRYYDNAERYPRHTHPADNSKTAPASSPRMTGRS